MGLFRKMFLLMVLATVTRSLQGQDDHYWAQQFGAVSNTMGGAVVAGVRDNSAIYYNPGAQAFIENQNLSVDANLYRIDRIMIRDGAGDEADLNSSQLSIYPQIVSGLLNLVKVPKFNFGYAILTRNYSNILMNTRFTNRDLSQTPAEKVEFIGAFDYSNQLNEQWFGASAGYRHSEKLGIGLSVFGSYRGQTYSMTRFMREIVYEDSTAWFATSNVDENIRYTTFLLLAKLGVAYESGRWRLGLTLTSPALRLYGKGTIQREISLYASSENPEDTSVSFLILDRKSKVRTVYRYPFSIAGGVEYHTQSSRIAFTAEFFTGIGTYSVMHTTSEPLVYPPWLADSADVREYLSGYLNVNSRSRPVLNVAIGFSHDLSKRFTLLLGARTDFSAYENTENTDFFLHNTGIWDLYHASAGLSYHTTKQSITVGFNYSFSPRQSIDPYAIINPYTPAEMQSSLFAQTFGVVLGYRHYLKH
jgi:hypothetical protein